MSLTWGTFSNIHTWALKAENTWGQHTHLPTGQLEGWPATTMPSMQKTHLPSSSCVPLAPSARIVLAGICAHTQLQKQKEAKHEINPEISSHVFFPPTQASRRSCNQGHKRTLNSAMDWASKCPREQTWAKKPFLFPMACITLGFWA